MPKKTLTPLDMDGNKITSLGTPTSAQDAATKAYVDTAPASDSYATRLKWQVLSGG